ncbi:LOW QUALITY PROTEIN: zinc finger CCCH domain-containing protein 14 [Monomorium pharaonis]|uniref:LOW QUALITY PROTEIN: zinc finger CCCH domain-containing protein 14 n=1 Tax=Monomorium pharaonis TaxID=307658 RepID=UPI00102E1F68|nr:LOW QUALITY PROTEIN: zinc finger CCCH domain-containing protein 14 [Monomorium pharaonis]
MKETSFRHGGECFRSVIRRLAIATLIDSAGRRHDDDDDNNDDVTSRSIRWKPNDHSAIMDTRGIEVTNQLRSAIRAKLMELGVRYDEELPDYILVMVVNKKSRQQMHADLNLFLEDCTTIFVDWLHDQVLKKLQKVTVAKKKSSREFVPTIVVKQEEERKKRKISATSFLEDHVVEQASGSDKIAKGQDKQQAAQKQQITPKSSELNQKEPERSHSRSAERSVKSTHGKSKTDEASSTHSGSGTSYQDTSSRRPQQSSGRDENPRDVAASENPTTKTTADSYRDPKASEAPDKSLKRSLEQSSSNRHDSTTEKKSNEAKRPKPSEEEENANASSSSSPDTALRKLKSCVNKPRITSVVSVKNRLGVISPRKKFETYREKEGNGRYRPLEKRPFEKPHRYDNGGRGGGKGRNFETDDRTGSGRRNRDGDSSRHHEAANKVNDVRSRIESSKNERLNRNVESTRERIPNSNSKTDASSIKKSASTIKDRLGVAGINSKPQRPSVKSQEAANYRNNPKSVEQAGSNNKNIKDRLGPLRNNFRPVHKQRQLRGGEEDESLDPLNSGVNIGEREEEKEDEDEVDNDEQSSIGPVKSHIVAVNRSATSAVTRIERKRMKTSNEIPFNVTQSTSYSGGHGGVKSQLDKLDKETSSDMDEDTDDTKLPSKVIVTPRPLKPLQPTQKRATQSLLLRAVAEANQSVVTQKNPEPSLFDKKPVLKRLKPAPARDVSQNLSVHFNSNKRLVMEKIQVELNTIDHPDVEDVEHEPYVPQPVTDEHMGVVMSLFQRSDDNQKFLVTLNGYNNNLMKEKFSSEDDEERLEMEVNEDDELALLTTHNDSTTAEEMATTMAQDKLEMSTFRITDGTEDHMNASPKEASGEENNENCNTENVDKTDEVPRRRRKLSPIVYNRSPSPTQLKSNASLVPTLAAKPPDKIKPLVENTVSVVSDKSRENCRYWPNCTLGNKCAYLHPPVMCSAFPACKFGDKCAYKHPKCKFGLSCTKLGCVFSHPTQQCKYHPFCTKPACPYSHPITSAPVTEITTQRAKFTWRRRD